jgi:hypothetical protein
MKIKFVVLVAKEEGMMQRVIVNNGENKIWRREELPSAKAGW